MLFRSTATSLIYEAAGNDANIIFGAVIDPSMADEMRVTVIATGFGAADARPVPVERALKEKVVHDTPAGKSISLFPETVTQVQPEPETHREPVNVVPPVEEPVAVAADSGVPDYFGDANGGNGHGNGNGHGKIRPRVPLFTDSDRTVPAYLRRLTDDR